MEQVHEVDSQHTRYRARCERENSSFCKVRSQTLRGALQPAPQPIIAYLRQLGPDEELTLSEQAPPSSPLGKSKSKAGATAA